MTSGPQLKREASALTQWLARRDPRVLNAFAVTVAFATYFCMYAFRKPFAAATYAGEPVEALGSELQLKTLFVVAQILGYAISKYLGIRVCSEVGRSKRFMLLASLILAAEGALLLFGLLPADWPWLKGMAVFANGLPLGMVWGVVVLYLEGRRTSEVLLTGLSCSFIVASGVVKDVGRALMAGADFAAPTPASWGWSLPNPFAPVPEFWMPAVTGALFLPPFLLFAWLLEQLPEPTEGDVLARTQRQPMLRDQRAEFVRRYLIGIVAALTAYFVLTAYRDYRDNYAVEVFTQLGYDYENNKTIVSQAELLVACGVMAIVCQLTWVQDNRRGLVATYGVMIGGLLLIGAATASLDAGWLNGFWWMTLAGFGAYLAYVPFNAVLFDRVVAATGFAGTAVFGIYLADTVGYSGSVLLQLSKDFLLSEAAHLQFLRVASYLLASVGVMALTLSCAAFLRRTARTGLADHELGPPDDSNSALAPTPLR